MPAGLIFPDPRTKPEPGAELDSSHPRLAGCVSFWPMAEAFAWPAGAIGGTAPARDAVGGRSLVARSSLSPPYRAATPEGPGFRTGTSTGSFQHARPPLTSCAAFSFVGRFRVVAVPASLYELFGKWGGDVSQHFCRWDSGLAWFVQAASSAQASATIPSASVPIGRVVTGAWVANGATLRAYLDGVLLATASLAGPYLASSADPWTIGGGSYGAAADTVEWLQAAYFNRALTAEEARGWAADPYGVFLPPPTRRSLPSSSSSSAGSTTVSPPGIGSAEAFGTPVLSAGAVSITPSGVASLEAWGTPLASPGPMTASPPAIGSAEAFGTPSLAPGSVTASPPGIDSSESFGTPALAASSSISVPLDPSWADYNSGNIPGGVTFRFAGTSFTVHPYVFSSTTDFNFWVSVDGGAEYPVDASSATEHWGEVGLASGLADAVHEIHFRYNWNGLLTRGGGVADITASGPDPVFHERTILPANADGGLIRISGTWPYGSSWNLLQGMLSFDVTDSSGLLAIWVRGFTSQPDPLRIGFDGAYSDGDYTADGYWQTIADGVSLGRHSVEILNTTSGRGYGFFGNGTDPFVLVWRDPSTATPAIAAYTGSVAFPDQLDPAMAGPDRVPSNDIYEAAVGFATTGACTAEALVARSGAEYTVRTAGTDTTVASLPSGGGYDWVSLPELDFSGATSLAEITSPGPPPPPQIYALRSTPPGRLAAPTTRRPRIGFYGDSITYVQAGQAGYAWRIAKALVASELNWAMPTHTSTDILAKLGSTLDEMSAGTILPPDIFSFLWGANDVSGSLGASTTGDNTTSAISAIRARYPTAPILFNGMVRGNSATGDYTAYNDAIEAACDAADANVHYIDHVALATDLSTYNSDGIHYTTSGYDQMVAAATPYYQAALDPVDSVSPPGIASSESWGSPGLAPGPVTLGLAGIASSESWGVPVLVLAGSIAAPGIPSSESWGSPALVPGPIVASPSAIASSESWGQPTLASGASVAPPGIASSESWGAPSLTAGAMTASPAGIPSAGSFGSPTLSGVLVISVPGIVPAEGWGVPALAGGDAVIYGTGRPDASYTSVTYAGPHAGSATVTPRGPDPATTSITKS